MPQSFPLNVLKEALCGNAWKGQNLDNHAPEVPVDAVAEFAKRGGIAFWEGNREVHFDDGPAKAKNAIEQNADSAAKHQLQSPRQEPERAGNTGEK